MDNEQIRRLAATLRNMGWLVPVGAIQSALHAENLCLAEADDEIERLRSALAELLQVQDGLPMTGMDATRRAEAARALLRDPAAPAPDAPA
jgi:hypothetical protein